MTDVDALLSAIDEAHSRGLLTQSAVENLVRWLTEPAYSDSVPEIAELVRQGDWETLDDSFYTVLRFGTGGRRGPRGVGPNRINARTIAESARGLADWVLSRKDLQNGSIVIAHDTRHASEELARVCAEVVAAAGLTAYVFDGFRPTPQLSFTVRHLRASAGIVISASHNPPADNGFKAYGADGGQLVPPDDEAVLRAVEQTMGKPIPRMAFRVGRATGRICVLDSTADEVYLSAVLATSRCQAREVRIVYTPLHGAGIRSVPAVLRNAGFRDVHLVRSQAKPDGDFPNVSNNIPNPEEEPALNDAAKLARRIGADIAIGTDPDADRLGCWAKRTGTHAGIRRLTGNQLGAILCYHVLDTQWERGLLRPERLVLTTTVTSPMIGKIARHFGVGIIEDLLVGFKYMACVMRSIRDPERVVFACEESHGYLGGPYTRDKDGAGGALLLGEATARWKDLGLDLWDVLDEIYGIVGYHCDLMCPYLSPGRAGMDHIQAMIEGIRSRPPEQLAGLRVLRMTDRWENTERVLPDGPISQLPPICDPLVHEPIDSLRPARDNLLIFEIEGSGRLAGAKAAIRPSGTEPKCKFYASGWASERDSRPLTRRDVDRLTAAIRDALMDYAEEAARDYGRTRTSSAPPLNP